MRADTIKNLMQVKLQSPWQRESREISHRLHSTWSRRRIRISCSCCLTSSSSPVLAFSLCVLWLCFKDIEVSCCLSSLAEPGFACFQTRYVMKYRHCDGKLVLKVTDDKVCLKFKTDQAQDIRKMEKLNNTFFSMMARGPDAEVLEDLPKEPVAPPSKKGRGRRQ